MTVNQLRNRCFVIYIMIIFMLLGFRFESKLSSYKNMQEIIKLKTLCDPQHKETKE